MSKIFVFTSHTFYDGKKCSFYYLCWKKINFIAECLEAMKLQHILHKGRGIVKQKVKQLQKLVNFYSEIV